ncbi:MAG: glycosyltransferase family 4 protein [Candidatus Omnitrophota bacterium]|jgi:glycosyltransferase involved in cell wall biosynthesis
MNIIQLTSHLDIGGISSYVLTLGKGLKKRGHNLYVATSSGELLGRLREEGVTYIPIPIKTKSELSPKVFISLVKLLKVTKEKNIDIIHAHTRVTQVLACLLSRYSGKPFISTCHGFFKRRLSRRIFPCWGKKVIAISGQVKEHLVKDFGVEEEKIKIIHNGIDIERYTKHDARYSIQKRKELGLSSAPVIGIIARLSDVKGHVYLLEAMKSVLENMPQAQLLIVGKGRMQRELAGLSRQLGIKRSVFFIPPVLDTAEILPVMDVFVMPSLKEGLGLALMEAMAQGLAVVGSRVGGIKSLIQDGKNGILVEPADVAGLSEAILRLLNDAKKRADLGVDARNFIRESFSQEEMIKETEGVYLECAGKE